MKLTNEIVEEYGFVKINNSMWRMDNITLQNSYSNTGDTFVERLLNTAKAYKVCIDGRYACVIETAEDLKYLVAHLK